MLESEKRKMKKKKKKKKKKKNALTISAMRINAGNLGITLELLTDVSISMLKPTYHHHHLQLPCSVQRVLP